MARTVIALYDDFVSASKATEGLIDRGYIREKISIVSNDVRGEHAKAIQAVQADEAAETGESEFQVQLKDLQRALLNLGTMEIPGAGPILAAGPITASLADSSELMKSLMSLGIPEQSAHYYAEGVRKGGTIVALEVSREATQKAIETLNSYGPVDMKKRVQQWQEGGWNEYDPSAEPLREEQLWPREEYRKPEERADTEMEEQLWPREEYRKPEEKVDTEKEEQLWPREEYREPEEKADTEEARQLWPRDEYRDKPSLAEEFTTPPGEKPAEVGVPPIPKEEQLWPREEYRKPEEKAETEKEEQLWPREEYRKPEEKAETEEDEELWPRDEYRASDEKAEAAEEKVIYPRGEIRAQQEDKATASGFKTYESAYRKHFEASVTEPGTTFDQYQPAYRYGYNLAVSERFKEYKEWEKLEPMAKRYWNERNPGTWDRYKESVRKGWEEVKGIKMQPSNG